VFARVGDVGEVDAAENAYLESGCDYAVDGRLGERVELFVDVGAAHYFGLEQVAAAVVVFELAVV